MRHTVCETLFAELGMRNAACGTQYAVCGTKYAPGSIRHAVCEWEMSFLPPVCDEMAKSLVSSMVFAFTITPIGTGTAFICRIHVRACIRIRSYGGATGCLYAFPFSIAFAFAFTCRLPRVKNWCPICRQLLISCWLHRAQAVLLTPSAHLSAAIFIANFT